MRRRLTLAIFVTFLGFFGIATSAGSLNGDCKLKYPDDTEVEDIEWVYDLVLHQAVSDISKPGTEIARFSTENIEQITGGQSKYIKPELVNGYLILTLNKDFVFFEEWETEPDLKITLEFRCGYGTGQIVMRALVEDSNGHAPEFVGAHPYLYTLPLPFPPGVPLGCATGVAVSARDIDLSTSRVYFEVQGSDALRVAASWREGRVYFANVTTARYITAPFAATLRATDNGDPPRSSETELIVEADAARSLRAEPAAAPAPAPARRAPPPAARTPVARAPAARVSATPVLARRPAAAPAPAERKPAAPEHGEGIPAALEHSGSNPADQVAPPAAKPTAAAAPAPAPRKPPILHPAPDAPAPAPQSRKLAASFFSFKSEGYGDVGAEEDDLAIGDAAIVSTDYSDPALDAPLYDDAPANDAAALAADPQQNLPEVITDENFAEIQLVGERDAA